MVVSNLYLYPTRHLKWPSNLPIETSRKSGAFERRTEKGRENNIFNNGQDNKDQVKNWSKIMVDHCLCVFENAKQDTDISI